MILHVQGAVPDVWFCICYLVITIWIFVGIFLWLLNRNLQHYPQIGRGKYYWSVSALMCCFLGVKTNLLQSDAAQPELYWGSHQYIEYMGANKQSQKKDLTRLLTNSGCWKKEIHVGSRQVSFLKTFWGQKYKKGSVWYRRPCREVKEEDLCSMKH